jgi:S-(hydroxymethyl)glutathione dehydrogenase/alcohol dehydrogenase
MTGTSIPSSIPNPPSHSETITNEHIGQAFGAIRKAGTVVVVGVSNEREGAPVPGFNAITVAMFQKRIQGSLYGMGSPAMRCPTC